MEECPYVLIHFIRRFYTNVFLDATFEISINWVIDFLDFNVLCATFNHRQTLTAEHLSLRIDLVL